MHRVHVREGHDHVVGDILPHDGHAGHHVEEEDLLQELHVPHESVHQVSRKLGEGMIVRSHHSEGSFTSQSLC